MKQIFLLLLLLTGKMALAVSIQTSDLQHFWQAYDRIQHTNDPKSQIAIIDSLFIQTASEAQNALFTAKKYSAETYLKSIQQHPDFWKSIRKQMATVGAHTPRLQGAFNRIQALNPNKQEHIIYLCVGVFEMEAWPTNNGLGIGSELLLADKSVNSQSVIQQHPQLKPHFKMLTTQHYEEVVLLNYTKLWFEQSNSCHVLAESIREGLCSWLIRYGLEDSQSPEWLKKGRKNEKKLKADFAAVMFSPFYENWLTQQPHPVYKYSYPARYIGFALVERYLSNTKDTVAALQKLLKLDYFYDDDVAEWVDEQGYFDEKLADLRDDYEASRPRVRSMAPIANGDTRVDYTLTSLVVSFSEPIDPRYFQNSRGPLGKQAELDIRKVSVSPDGRFVTLTVRLQPNTKYQLVIDEAYRNPQGIPIQPYLIEFKTKLREGSTFED